MNGQIQLPATAPPETPSPFTALEVKEQLKLAKLPPEVRANLSAHQLASVLQAQCQRLERELAAVRTGLEQDKEHLRKSLAVAEGKITQLEDVKQANERMKAALVETILNLAIVSILTGFGTLLMGLGTQDTFVYWAGLVSSIVGIVLGAIVRPGLMIANYFWPKLVSKLEI